MNSLPQLTPERPRAIPSPLIPERAVEFATTSLRVSYRYLTGQPLPRALARRLAEQALRAGELGKSV